MAATNMDDSEKLPLLVVGKSENPRLFRGVSLTVTYNHPKNAWTNGAIFQTWLTDINNRTKKRWEHSSHRGHLFSPSQRSSCLSCLLEHKDKSSCRWTWPLLFNRATRVSQASLRKPNGEEGHEWWTGLMTMRQQKALVSPVTSLLDSLHMRRVAWAQVTAACFTNYCRKADVSQRPLEDEEHLSCQDSFNSENFSATVACDDLFECYGSLGTSDIVHFTLEEQQDSENTDDIEEDYQPTVVLSKVTFAAIETLKTLSMPQMKKQVSCLILCMLSRSGLVDLCGK